MSSEEQIIQMLKQNDEKMEKIYASVEKTRKYFLYSLIITILMFILPLIGLIIVIPMFMDSYIGALKGI